MSEIIRACHLHLSLASHCFQALETESTSTDGNDGMLYALLKICAEPFLPKYLKFSAGTYSNCQAGLGPTNGVGVRGDCFKIRLREICAVRFQTGLAACVYVDNGGTG